MRQRRRSHWVLGFAAALLLAAGLVVVTSPAAHAHASIVGTEPANGSQLDAAPDTIRLWFNERVTVAADGVRLQTGDGDVIETAPAEVDPELPTQVLLPAPADLTDGTYLVVYRIVSADSHPISGAVVFSIGEPVADLADLDLGGDDPGLVTIFGVARFTGYAGLALLTGALAVFVLCWPAGAGHPRARRLVRVGWLVSVLSALAVLLLQGGYAAGRTLAGLTDLSLVWATLDTDYGRYIVARLLLLTIAGGLLFTFWRDRLEGPRRLVALGLVVGLPATWIGTGHSNTGTLLDVSMSAVHLATMTGWFGGLVLLAACLLPRSANVPNPEVAPALRRFSLLATGSVAALVITGVYIAWREVGSFGALAGTSYGRLLAFKLAVVGLLLWLGAMSRSVVQKRFAGSEAADQTEAASRSGRRSARGAAEAKTHARGQLRQSVRLEVGTAVAVLAVVAVLVATPPGVVVTAEASEPVLTEPVRATLPLFEEDEDQGVLRVLVDPAQPGPNRIVLSVWGPDRELWDVPEVRASLSLAAQELGPLVLTLTPLGPGEYEASDAQLPAGGDWELRVTVRTSDIDSTTLLVEVPIG